MKRQVGDLKNAVTAICRAEGISVGGTSLPAQVVVSRDWTNRATEPYESAADRDRLWLKAGDSLEFVVDPGAVFNGDGTGLTACYAKEGDVDANRRVVNVHLTESGNGKLSATGQRPRDGITQIRHITGLYRMWDELLARRPQMLIDNCASGGRRFDIETLRRSVAFFRSDYQCGFNANADVMQAHNAGISRLLPYNGCTVKLSDVYSLRSAYSASHGVAYWNAIFQKEEKVDWAAAKKCCDEYRRIRKYFPCDFYNHGSSGLDLAAWAIWQYNDPEKGEGVVLAFRRAESPSSQVSIPLKGLPKDAAVEIENLDTGAKSTVKGDLEITLPERRSSTVILYRVR